MSSEGENTAQVAGTEVGRVVFDTDGRPRLISEEGGLRDHPAWLGENPNNNPFLTERERADAEIRHAQLERHYRGQFIHTPASPDPLRFSPGSFTYVAPTDVALPNWVTPESVGVDLAATPETPTDHALFPPEETYPLPQTLLNTTTVPTIRDFKAANWQKLKDYIRGNYPEPETLSQYQRLLESIQYIENLGAQVSADPALWSLRDLGFPTFSDRNTLNVLFFKEWEKRKSDALPGNLAAGLAAHVEAITEAHFQNLQNDIEHQRLDLKTLVERKLKEANVNLEKAHKLTIQLNRLLDRKIGIVPMINEIQEGGYFKYRELTSDKRLFFETTQDCILTYDNDATEQHFRVNFGRFLVEYRLTTGAIYVLEHENNLSIEDTYHPHVGSGGKVCWGSGAGTAAKHLINVDLPKLFRLLHGVMTSYNDENPFIGLADYQRLQLSSAPPNYKGAGSHPPICQNCERYENECDCQHCEACDVRFADGEEHDGNYCEHCERCYGSGTSRCPTHYCRLCDDYREPGECDCCYDCERSECECTRCPDCDERREYSCSRPLCLDCDRHLDDCECEDEAIVDAPAAAQQVTVGVPSPEPFDPADF